MSFKRVTESEQNFSQYLNTSTIKLKILFPKIDSDKIKTPLSGKPKS